MTSETPTDVLPILSGDNTGFDVAMRGYDRAQVDHYVAKLDDELRVAGAERDAALSRSADMAAQVASIQAQNESLRRQLESATRELTEDTVDDKVREILAVAHADAAKVLTSADEEAETIRRAAVEAAERVRATAAQEAEALVAAATERHVQADEMFRTRLAEIEHRRETVDAALAESEAKTRAEEQRLTTEAAAERKRLDAEAKAERERLNDEAREERETLEAESTAKRAQAEEDFEITLRKRRSDELAESQRIIAEATAKAQEIEEYRAQVHEQLASLHSDLGATVKRSKDASPKPVE